MVFTLANLSDRYSGTRSFTVLNIKDFICLSRLSILCTRFYRKSLYSISADLLPNNYYSLSQQKQDKIVLDLYTCLRSLPSSFVAQHYNQRTHYTAAIAKITKYQQILPFMPLSMKERRSVVFLNSEHREAISRIPMIAKQNFRFIAKFTKETKATKTQLKFDTCFTYAMS